MQILVDHRPYQPCGPPDLTVADLADEVCRASGTRPARLVVAVRCNGELVTDDGLSTVLKTPIGHFQRLELQTQPVAALVRSTLAQAVQVFQDAAETRHQIADLLTEGKQEAAMGQLQTLLQVWRQVQDAMVVSARALGTDLEAMRTSGRGLSDILELLRDRLSELKKALENHDGVVVGDILRYDLDEPFALWVALLKQLHDQAEARQGQLA